ncbi:hypothetical protein [Nocardia asiatica]|uniref:hypothetical protein n=1 Tax=Nocardia asiatica TaxID=209252 RepID=UPI003EE220BF
MSSTPRPELLRRLRYNDSQRWPEQNLTTDGIMFVEVDEDLTVDLRRRRHQS